MILKYRQCLRKGWPEHPTKPNLHLTQHYSKVIKRFGKPQSTAAWAQERVNGMLQRLPNNHQPRKIPKTMMKEWHLNSKYQLLLNSQERKKTSGMVGPASPEKKEKSFELNGPLMTKWKRAIAGKETSRGRLGQEQLVLNSTVALLGQVSIDGKNFTPLDHHTGNSLVEFWFGADQRFGTIQKVFKSTQTPGQTWLLVDPFKELDHSIDPYGEYPDLNCCLVKDELEAHVIVEREKVIGHVAVLRNPGGTFVMNPATGGSSSNHAPPSGANASVPPRTQVPPVAPLAAHSWIAELMEGMIPEMARASNASASAMDPNNTGVYQLRTTFLLPRNNLL
ncbi:hypothetical protein PCASD_18022 [Puccinia coronata f. sp. avenae]|uniref:Uncharacterized protein n=1 Tax=Puccinia coronata f. sp. avenae TaxID=200324 RepID=A0A2N5UC54_9BASI|nr:hypothetical protein PCASD_18022 [Puccinia coronata f. sp. avenae]